MTKEEAIKKHIKENELRIDISNSFKFLRTVSDADRKKHEKDIYVLTEVNEALEKQIPKKPKYSIKKDGIITTNYECPVCGCRRLGHGFDLNKCYCPECGQKLDWSDI